MVYYEYQLCVDVSIGTEKEPIVEKQFLDKRIPKCEANRLIAEAEAYNGEYSIYDDGQPEPEAPESDIATWDELAAAYSEGVQSA